MPRTPRNPGTGKAPHNGPAQGPALTWGGAARGGVSNSKAGIAGPGQGTHRSVADLMAAKGAREKSADAWMAIIEDPAHPRHADMVAKAADRLDGAPMQRNEVTMRDVPADELGDDELAAIVARGRARATDAPGDPG